MSQCEMCGEDVPSLKTVRIEGAEIDVCDDCARFGTEVKTESTSSTSTKYSTGSGGASASGSTTASAGGDGGSTERRSDMFDEMEEIAQDYDQRIRSAREAAGLTQEELSDQLNEKASLIRKLEHGDSLPSDDVQEKLERKLDITLTESGGLDMDEWESESSAGTYTLGDVVKRKD